jgi:hypothetical protein
MKKLLLLTFFLLLGSGCNPAPSDRCDPSLKPYVYSPDRFYPDWDPKKAPPYDTKPMPGSCVQVTGTIVRTIGSDSDTIRPPGEDGDIHFSLQPDAPKPGFLQPTQPVLVVEVICAKKPTESIEIGPARVRCQGYPLPDHLSHENLKQFKVGDRVKITGLQVIDYEHKDYDPATAAWYGRTEIHPVSEVVRAP